MADPQSGPISASEQEPPLLEASCDLPSTQPLMWLGLPRTIAGLIGTVCIIAIIWQDSFLAMGGIALVGGIVWFAVRELVEDDLWGFNIAVSWFITVFWFLDSGSREWGGARFAALPQHSSTPFGATVRAVRFD